MQSKSRCRSAQAPPPPSGPAPPPMPVGDLFADVNKDVAVDDSATKSRAQLFAQLNLGEDVTKGLKKVTANMQTHKNPSLRSSNVVTSASGNTSVSFSVWIDLISSITSQQISEKALKNP